MKKKKVLFLGNSKLTVFGFRGEIIEELIKNNYDVVVIFPNGPFGEGQKEAEKYGCKFIELKMSRRGKNPFEDLKLLRNYINIFKEENPDIVCAFTVKCDVYGGLACRILKIPFIPNITGLGKGLVEGNITKFITKTLYKLSIKKAKCVFFQNEGDKKFFVDNNIKYYKGIILPGSGVNLKKFSPIKYPNENEPIRFIYVARIMKAKGIEEYLKAAEIIKIKYPNTEFHICGFCEEDYKSIIDEKIQRNEIIYHGLVDDVKKYEKTCHCVVLPSYHPEGISNVLLEAAANARPIITTNRIGCKECVIDEVSGYLINEKNVQDLVDKMEKFILLPYTTKVSFGLNGRKHIEDCFDRNIVIKNYLCEIDRGIK